MMWLLGFIFSLGLAWLAYRRGSLTLDGLAGSVFVGTSIMGGIGWAGFLVLAFFFVSSTGLGKVSFRLRPEDEAERHIVQKGGAQDIWQVLANGGVSAAAAQKNAATGQNVWLLAFAAALSAATADTWASEVGRLSNGQPRHVFSWQKVQSGTSGAVTVLGTLASVGGALLSAFVSYPVLRGVSFSTWQGGTDTIFPILFLVALCGWLGNVLDTIAGASWQLKYVCPSCGRKTEKEKHCGRPTQRIQGIPGFTNDTVNLLCTVFAGVSVLLSYFFL
jgi:uncharacterized protein (TIGR00297 family)